MEQQPMNSYDEVPYPSKPFSQTHPRTLATTATLFGMSPPDIHKCRVLELGCASGNNIVPMASELRDSEFVGVELSEVQANNARTTANSLGLKNIAIRQCNILDVDDSFGEFDYIIAHGIFSWVPTEVQQHILKLSRERLGKQGVAYISYNTNPGWRMRGMLRDIMLFHARNFTDVGTRIAQSRALINFLAETLTGEKSAYATLLQNEVELMKNWEDAYFRHDSLEEVNDPVYFYEFMARADEQGLQYLGEVDVNSMVANNFSDKVKETLDKVGNNIIQREQYMDFIRNRMFRQTLLCHREVSLTREIDIGLATRMSIAANCVPTLENPALTDNSSVDFKLDNGPTFSTTCPFTKSIAYSLGKRWPAYVVFDDLENSVHRTLYHNSLTITADAQLNRDRQIICARIFELFIRGILGLTLYPPTVKTDVSDRPIATPIARLQASKQTWATNCLHQPVAVDLVKRHLLPILDGNHDRSMIQDEMLRLIKNKTLLMQLDGVTMEDDEQIREKLDIQISAYMEHVAKSGLLLS